MPAQTARLDTINLVTIPSTDQDRSIEFYVDTLGFEKRTDVPFGNGYRWVEVYPPTGTTVIALAPPPEGAAVGVQTGISLTTGDIDAILGLAGGRFEHGPTRAGDFRVWAWLPWPS